MKTRNPRSYDKPTGTMVLGLDVVLTQKTGAVDPSSLRPPDKALLELIDGKRTIEEVLQLSQTSWFVAMRRLRSLCERGVLVSGPAAAPTGGTPAGGSHTPATGTDQRPRTMDLTDVVGKLFTPGAASTTSSVAAPGFTPAASSTNSRDTPIGRPMDEMRTLSMGALAQAAARVPTEKIQPIDPVIPTAPMSETAPTAEPDPLADALGKGKKNKSFKLGRYEVVTRIGQGGMGSVYLCRQPGHWGFQRLFTLKVIREHAAQDREAMRSFLREARVGGLLSHPNILGVVDVGSFKGQPFLVMDYVEGGSLSDLLEGSQPPPASLLIPVLLDALRGLQSAHEQTDARGTPLGIVHCDVSPHNIMVGLDGAARITDFGSARMNDEPNEQDEDLPAVGKPGYMSPEQLCGNPIDGRTDVFAMGVVMWTALTGKRLFVDPSYEQTIINVLRRKVDPPSMHGAPAALDEVCLKALARSPEGRYQSAEEMRLALHRVASREGLIASTAEISRWVKRTVGETLEERRRRILTTFAETDPGAPPVTTSRRGSTDEIPAQSDAPAAMSKAAAADPERFRPTMVLPAVKTEGRRRYHHTPESTKTLDTDDARRLRQSLERRPWIVILVAAAVTAGLVFALQAFLRNQRLAQQPRPRPTIPLLPEGTLRPGSVETVPPVRRSTKSFDVDVPMPTAPREQP